MDIPKPDYRDLTELSSWVVTNLPILVPNDLQLPSTLAIAERWLSLSHYNPTPLQQARSMGTPKLKTLLVTLIREMDVRPMGKNPKLKELAEWVVAELPNIAPNDPRTPKAVALAQAALVRMY